MKIEGTHTFAAPRDVVWPMILDPGVLSQILPGCEQLELVEEGRYEGALKIKVGPVQGSFDGTITVSDVNEPESASFSLTGDGAPGFVTATGHFRLVDEGPASVVEYEGDAQIGGKLAAVGQRLLDSTSRAIIKSGLEGLDAQIEAATASPEPGADAGNAETTLPPIAPPSEIEFATGVARHMINDAFAPENRAETVRTIVLAAGLALVLYGLWRRLRPRGEKG